MTYSLSIKVDGAEYKAESTMPHPVSLMDLTIEEEWSPREERKSVVAWFQDLPSTKNYYRFRAQKENRSFNGAYVFEDKAYDGQYIRYAIDPDEDNEDLQLKSGDQVEVELQCVDPMIFLYFLTLSQYTGTGRGLPIAPGNPLSNISNGAMGYFNAHTTSTRTIVVP